MCTAGAVPLERLLQAGTREPGPFRADAAHRRAVHAHALLRLAAYDGEPVPAGLRGERQAGAAADAPDGALGDCARAAYEPSPSGARCVSLALTRSGGGARQPGVEYRNHPPPDAVGIHVSGGYPGLYSRYVLGFALSNRLDTVFCLEVKYEDIYLRDYGSVRGARRPAWQPRAAAPVARLPHASGGARGGQTLTTRLLIFATSWS